MFTDEEIKILKVMALEYKDNLISLEILKKFDEINIATENDPNRDLSALHAPLLSEKKALSDEVETVKNDLKTVLFT